MNSETNLFSDLARDTNGIALIAFWVGLVLAIAPRTRRLAGSIVIVAALTWGAVLFVTAASLLWSRGRLWELGAGIAVAALLHVAIHRRTRSSVSAGILAVFIGVPSVAVLDAFVRGEAGLQSGRLFTPLLVGVIAVFALGRWITRRGLASDPTLK